MAPDSLKRSSRCHRHPDPAYLPPSRRPGWAGGCLSVCPSVRRRWLLPATSAALLPPQPGPRGSPPPRRRARAATRHRCRCRCRSRPRRPAPPRRSERRPARGQAGTRGRSPGPRPGPRPLRPGPAPARCRAAPGARGRGTDRAAPAARQSRRLPATSGTWDSRPDYRAPPVKPVDNPGRWGLAAAGTQRAAHAAPRERVSGGAGAPEQRPRRLLWPFARTLRGLFPAR